MVKGKTSPRQKTQNSHQTQNFKGVRMRKWGKWVSEVRMPNSRARIWLGSYDSPQQAARAYDCAVYCLRGSNSNFNFPDSLPEIPSASSFSPAQIQRVAAKFAVDDDDTAVLSGLESQSTVDGQKILEEPALRPSDSLLQDSESGQSQILDGFLPPDEVFSIEDIDFLLPEKRGDFFEQTDQRLGLFPESR